MSAWSPADGLCRLTATATCAAQKVQACAALSLWDWCMNIPFTALTGLSDMSLSIWLIFPSAADSRFYTKITEWVFLVRKTRLFCSWVTFLWSLLIPLPRSSDVLAKKDCKHLPGITFRQVCLLLASTYQCPQTTFISGKHKAATLCPCNYCDCLHKSSGFVCKWPVSI